MRAPLPALFMLLIGISTPGSGLEWTLGLASGLFVAPDPGTPYATPLSVGVFGRAYFDLPYSIHADAGFTLLPFVPNDSDSDSSLMTVFEGGVGAGIELLEYRDGAFRVGGLIGGGAYVRPVTGSRGNEIARRPIGYVAPYALLSLLSWEYQLSIRYRILFDQAVVHTVEPAVAVSYRFDR